MTTLQELFALGEEFNNRSIRVCDIGGVKHASVLNVINAITDVRATSAWTRTKAQYPEVDTGCTYTFPGQGARPTPVANACTMLQIIFKFPGSKATRFCEDSAFAFLQTLNPSEEFIECLKDRMDLLNDGRVGDDVTSFLAPTVDHKIVRLAPRGYNETSLYVRIRVPDDYVVTVTNPKQLTMDIIKFGIAYSVHDRHITYLREPDNGFMALSFPCCSRQEAEIVENVLKYDFIDLTVLSSREYLDASGLAERLDYDLDTSSYASYVGLAQTLFSYAIHRVKALWPEKYSGRYGNTYDIVESTPKLVQATITSTGAIGRQVPLEVELSFRCNVITETLAIEMGLSDGPRGASTIAVNHVDVSPLRTGPFAASAPDVETPTWRRNSSSDTSEPLAPCSAKRAPPDRTSVIGRDVETGTETEYDNVEQAAHSCSISPSALRRTFLDKPRQAGGKHWRKPGNPYWIPPSGFTYDANTFETTSTGYVQAVSPKGEQTRVFESRTAAAKIMGFDRRTLTDHIVSGKEFHGFVWSDLPFNEWGTWSDAASTSSGAREYVLTPVRMQDTGIDGRNNGKVVETILATGEEIVHNSATRAAACNLVSANFMKDTLVDKPRQANGKCFRSILATHKWQPPETLKFDDTCFEKNMKGYIVACDSTGTVTAMYESIRSAAKLEGINRWGISQFMASSTEFMGRFWRHAEPPEYQTFVPVNTMNV